MVGRNVLDGLRKGKKDIYALNVQYVRRYSWPADISAVLHLLLLFTIYLMKGES